MHFYSGLLMYFCSGVDRGAIKAQKTIRVKAQRHVVLEFLFVRQADDAREPHRDNSSHPLNDRIPCLWRQWFPTSEYRMPAQRSLSTRKRPFQHPHHEIRIVTCLQ